MKFFKSMLFCTCISFSMIMKAMEPRTPANANNGSAYASGTEDVLLTEVKNLYLQLSQFQNKGKGYKRVRRQLLNKEKQMKKNVHLYSYSLKATIIKYYQEIQQNCPFEIDLSQQPVLENPSGESQTESFIDENHNNSQLLNCDVVSTDHSAQEDTLPHDSDSKSGEDQQPGEEVLTEESESVNSRGSQPLHNDEISPDSNQSLSPLTSNNGDMPANSPSLRSQDIPPSSSPDKRTPEEDNFNPSSNPVTLDSDEGQSGPVPKPEAPVVSVKRSNSSSKLPIHDQKKPRPFNIRKFIAASVVVGSAAWLFKVYYLDQYYSKPANHVESAR